LLKTKRKNKYFSAEISFFSLFFSFSFVTLAATPNNARKHSANNINGLAQAER